MAQKAIQAGNTIITFDDTVYTATPQTNSDSTYMVLRKANSIICTIYNNAIIYWDVPPALANITTKGQYAVITLT